MGSRSGTLLTLSAFRYCGGTLAYTSIMVLINAMSPPHVVGLANGLAQSVVSAARFLGPVIGGAVRRVTFAPDRLLKRRYGQPASMATQPGTRTGSTTSPRAWSSSGPCPSSFTSTQVCFNVSRHDHHEIKDDAYAYRNFEKPNSHFCNSYDAEAGELILCMEGYVCTMGVMHGVELCMRARSARYH